MERLEEQAEVCSEASFLTYHNNQLEPGDKEWHQGHSKYNNQDKDMTNFTQTIGDCTIGVDILYSIVWNSFILQPGEI